MSKKVFDQIAEGLHEALAVARGAQPYKLHVPPESRELWRPSDEDQLSAIEILLACALSRELRAALRERAEELAGRVG